MIGLLLFKIFQEFLSPSVFLLVFFILGLILFKRKAGKILIIFGILIYYFFSITPIADLIIFPLEKQYATPEKINSYDTIVLLTGGLRNENLPLNSVLSESSLYRTIAVTEIYFKSLEKPKIIISGISPLYPQEKEAYFISKLLGSFNIPQEDIILEEKSRNTYESAKNVKKIVGDKSFLLVTSAYHMPRSIFIFKKIGTNPVPAPSDYRTKFLGKYNIFDFFPSTGNLKKVDIAFREYFGILYYHFLK